MRKKLREEAVEKKMKNLEVPNPKKRKGNKSQPRKGRHRSMKKKAQIRLRDHVHLSKEGELTEYCVDLKESTF